MELNFEMSPLTGSEPEWQSMAYSHMAEDEAQIAYSSRKEQIRAMLKSRSNMQTPDSTSSKVTIHSTRSKKSSEVASRFSANADSVSKHNAALHISTQLQQKERLKTNNPGASHTQGKYNTHVPIYQRTVEWRNNLIKQNEEQKANNEEKILNQCTFEPEIEKTEVRNMSTGLYERNIMWKNSMARRNEKLKEHSELKKLEECSFKPKIISATVELVPDFYERNVIWRERMARKAKMIDEEISKNNSFNPIINKKSSKFKASNSFNSRLDSFLNKLEEISNKIDNSLVDSAL